MKQAVNIVVCGKVQGVGFRYFVLQQARYNNIKGWVQNTLGQTVEIHAEGEKHDLILFTKMVSAGPTLSRVTKVLQNTAKIQNYTVFKIIA